MVKDRKVRGVLLTENSFEMPYRRQVEASNRIMGIKKAAKKRP